MLKFHGVLGRLVIYFLFFICFFGSWALFLPESYRALNPQATKASSEEAFKYLIQKYEKSSILSVKDLDAGGIEIAHYNPQSSKRAKKASRELFGENGALEYEDLSFFKVVHFKFFPAQGWFKQLGKALSSAVALGLLVAFVLGFFLLKRRQLFRLSAPKPRGRLHLAHVNFGILGGAFLAVFCLSGIGLNYLQDINNLFSNTPKQERKKTPLEEKKFALSSEQVQRLIEDFKVVYADAKTRLNTDKIEVLSLNRTMFIVRKADEFKSTFNHQENAAMLTYKGAKLLKESRLKNVDFLSEIYNFFYDIHRLHAAPFWLRCLIAMAGFGSCIFMIYSLKLAAFNDKFNYQNIFFASAIAASFFALCGIFGSLETGVLGFWLSFFIAFLISRLLSARMSFFIALICLISLVGIYTRASWVFLIIYIIYFGICLRKFYKEQRCN